MNECEPCESCELIRRRDRGEAPPWDRILRTSNFDVVHGNSTSLLGWIVIVAKRHLAAIDELNDAEAGELGTLIRNVSRALKSVSGCEKTYVIQFAEAQGHNHVHFHVVPRAADMPEAHRGVGVFHYFREGERTSDAEMNHFAERLRSAMNVV